MPVNITNQGLIRDVEILRAIAVLAVVAQHIPNNLIQMKVLSPQLASAMSGGWAGVDLFFAISGYVITRSFFAKGFNPGRTQIKAKILSFWIGRIFRLLPSAWLWLLVLLLASIFFNSSEIFGPVKTNMIWTAGGMLNFSNYLMVTYFSVERPGASFVYWSLSLEEQFYLLFPFLAILLRRKLVFVAVILILLQVCDIRGMWGLMFRTDAIAYGVIIAILQLSGRLPRATLYLPRPAALILVIALLYTLFYVASPRQTDFPYMVSIIALISALVLIPCSENKDILAGFGLLSRLLLWVGKRSYAVYLIHIPVIFALRELAFRYDLALNSFPVVTIISALVLIFVLSELNYRFLETPIREKGRTIAGRIAAGKSLNSISGSIK